jgi:acetoacetyl-CoA synthetase
MMWNWLVSVLAQGATIVLYEGSPSYPSLERLWQLSEELDITFFGASARYIHTLLAQEVSPQALADLSSLRTVASTGSPLSPQGFRFVFEHVKRDLHLASISGGTDIVGCFVAGVPTEPVYEGLIQGPVLGVDLAAFDTSGEKVFGEIGELVCLQSLPSMPIMFWGDLDFTRYRSAYFDTFPGVWRHGDLIEIDERGGVVIYGRSDATLNPGGVRIGTSEIYRPLEAFDEVVEAVAIGKRIASDEEIWLFVVLREGLVLTQELTARIEREIRSQESPRHVPKKILQATDLPRTRSGKLMEIAVSRAANGLPIPNHEVIENPESVAGIERAVSDAQQERLR